MTRQLGDPQEASIKVALDFLAGRPCTPIGGSGITAQSVGKASDHELITPADPTPAQREVPGLF